MQKKRKTRVGAIKAHVRWNIITYPILSFQKMIPSLPGLIVDVSNCPLSIIAATIKSTQWEGTKVLATILLATIFELPPKRFASQQWRWSQRENQHMPLWQLCRKPQKRYMSFRVCISVFW
jgi:hypothetical protein